MCVTADCRQEIGRERGGREGRVEWKREGTSEGGKGRGRECRWRGKRKELMLIL